MKIERIAALSLTKKEAIGCALRAACGRRYCCPRSREGRCCTFTAAGTRSP